MNFNGTQIPPGVSSVLIVDLEAIKHNYRHIQSLAPDTEIGVSIKSDAYGLGASVIAKTLASIGCKTFFVATIDEGVKLRSDLPNTEIVILNGPTANSEWLFVEHQLTPTLNSLSQIDTWKTLKKDNIPCKAAYLHIDTGMSRLGLSINDVSQLCSNVNMLNELDIKVIMSHLSCADDEKSSTNKKQLVLFNTLVKQLTVITGPVRLSLANSAGCLLGSDYHLDMIRPGASIYGLKVTKSAQNPMRRVVHLLAQIIQIRNVDHPSTVGYGATHKIKQPTKIATLAMGYADGIPRASGQVSNKDNRPFATAFINGKVAPIVGRISMDLITIDVTQIPEAKPGIYAELIGNNISIDDLADISGTIGYEILTRLGQRHHRIYKGLDN
ncbi:MAG: alanine racemase [Alphaproteobacteria bacterium]